MKSPTLVEVLYSFAHGGSEQVGIQLAKRFHARGIPVAAAALFKDGPLQAILEAENIESRYFGRWLLRGRSNPVFNYQLRKFLSALGPVSIHAHHGLTVGRVIPILASIDCRRLVYSEHSLEALATMPRYRKSVSRWCKEVDNITVLSDEMEEFFGDRLLVPRSKILVVPNGVQEKLRDASCLDSARHELGISSELINFVWIGRMHADKDLRTLVRAFGVVRRLSPLPCKLWLIGDGGEKSSLAAEIHKENLAEHTQMLGFRQDVSDILPLFDILVLSSRTEGMPMVILEAMMAKVPCIATDVGAIGELLDEDCGLIVTPEDPNALAEAMINLSKDRDLAARLAQRGYKRAKTRYDLDLITDKYISLLGG